jgi:hypothetical protein
MSILIKGMDMPEHGIHHGAIVISETGNHLVVNRKPYNKCFSISEIPTHHGRLIDADRLITRLKNTTGIAHKLDYEMFRHILSVIEHQPTVIKEDE